MVGVGGFGQFHLKSIVNQAANTQVVALCDPDTDSVRKAVEIFRENSIPVPECRQNLRQLLDEFQNSLDAALIVSPHVLHFQQSVDCLEAGLDVLLEKPMVMNGDQARELIRIRDRSGKLLVVAFPGSLSPQIRTAVRMLRSGEIGKILNISGTVWQNWGQATAETWRQDPGMSGGGFMFDSGAHLLNTVADLAGEEFDEVSAWLENSGRRVDTRCVAMAKLRSGVMVTLNGCGEAIPSCASDVRVFTSQAILYTGVWGEKLQIQYHGNQPVADIPLPPSTGVWEQFLKVRQGEITNPCPPEVGLRMANLWDAIKLSSENNGLPVKYAGNL